MQIIDQNGRLFGKVNVIDFLVVLFLLFLLPMFYLGPKLLNKKHIEPAVKREFIEVEIPCNLIKLKPTDLGLVAVGDKETDNENRQIGEIAWVGQPVPFKYTIDMGGGSMLLKEDALYKELPVRLKLQVEIKNDGIYYKNIRINVGSPFDFKTDKYMLTARPVTPYQARKELWKRIKVRFSGISPELSSMIKKGYREKDETGRVVGKLMEIVSDKPTEVQVLKMEESKFIFVSDPYRYDTVVLLDLLCTAQEGELYFKNYMMKIGNQINITSDLYTVSGSIINIEENK